MTALLNLLLLIIIVGVLMWLINNYIPMPGAIRSLLNIIVFIVLVIYVLQFFGLIKPVFPVIKIFR